MKHVEDSPRARAKSLVTCYWSIVIAVARGDAKGCSAHSMAEFGSKKEQ